MWCSRSNFLEVVHDCWEALVTGYAMVRLSQKLKKLKCVLRKWNIEVFGRVDVQQKTIEEKLNDLEQNVIQNFSQEAEIELLLCKQKHLDILHCQESMGSLQILADSRDYLLKMKLY